MNFIVILFILLNVALMLFLPRRWAPLPLLAGTCYMTLGQGIELGPFSFTILRIFIAVGLLRLVLKNERLSGGLNSLDWLMIAWGLWAIFSSLFHKNFSDSLISRLGLVYSVWGIYFLIRIFCATMEDAILLSSIVAFILLPVAIEMIFEQITSFNLFSFFGGVNPNPMVREGRLRAQGPFAHPILAGTVGSVSIPLMIALWRIERKNAIIGIIACTLMILASASSGPIISGMGAIGAMLMWKYRQKMRIVRWGAVLGYIGLDLIMNAPAYYLIARLKIIGGSTSYHRARLIESAFNYISEWWIAGTDYTRHWMVHGVPWSQDHADITNYYLKMGVIGGIPLMMLFIFILVKGFSYVGKSLKEFQSLSVIHQYFLWALGAALFTHALSAISVSYFDQSFIFLYTTLAAINSVTVISRNISVSSKILTIN